METVHVEFEVDEADVRPPGPRLRRRRADEDFDMVRLSSKDVPIVVKNQRSTGGH